MKHITLTIALLTTTIFIGHSQNILTPEEQVQQTVKDMFDGIAELNMDKVKANCTDDIVILENGITWNADSIELRLRSKDPKTFSRVNKIDFIETTIHDQIAWTYYNNQADIISNGQSTTVKWLESAILIKEGNAWRIKFLHVTELERIKH